MLSKRKVAEIAFGANVYWHAVYKERNFRGKLYR